MSNWQPISTAPKDGTFILVSCPSDSMTHVMIGWWCNGWCPDMMNKPFTKSPTHWMPLPAPPKETE